LVPDVRRISDYRVERAIRLEREEVTRVHTGSRSGSPQGPLCLPSRIFVEFNADHPTGVLRTDGMEEDGLAT
jgi:hypothetical protein